MKYLSIIIFLTSQFIYAQSIESNLKLQSTQLFNFLIEQKAENILNLIHPEVIDSLGGKDKYYLKLKHDNLKASEKNIRLKEVIITNQPKLYFIENTNIIQSLLEVKYVLESPNLKFSMNSFIVSFSNNKGTTWFFADETNYIYASNILDEIKHQIFLLNN